jgi:putative Holliday junction resolvase
LKVIALDVGTKTIGVAATDALGWFAHRVCTLARKGVKQDLVALQRIFGEREPEAVVVGLPYELDGSEARSAKLARQIGEAVRESTGLPVHYVDERFSSVDAERRLIESGISREKRKQVIDQEAAVVILESWLAQRASGAHVDP